MTRSTEDDQWIKKIQELFAAGRLTSHQCVLYSRNSRKNDNADEICGCQRPIRHHSFDGLSPEQMVKPEDWNLQTHTRKLRQLIYHSTASRKVGFCVFCCRIRYVILSNVSPSFYDVHVRINMILTHFMNS